MVKQISDRLVIGVSSRSLFDLSEETRIFNEEGLDSFRKYQQDHGKEILAPGAAFSLIQRFLQINKLFPEREPVVEVVIISRNSAETSFRIWSAINHYGLKITRGVFAGGSSTTKYLSAFSIDLFLSAELEDVYGAVQQDYAAARIEGHASSIKSLDEPIRIAFDGDCVLFSDESEKAFEEGGLLAFRDYEEENKAVPLTAGPFKKFAQKLGQLHKKIEDIDPNQKCIYTAFVTARNAPAHHRVLKTFQTWELWMDESFFLGGLPKGPILKAFNADIFFDDQNSNIISALDYDIPAAEVPRI